jgi:hypothetical protein
MNELKRWFDPLCVDVIGSCCVVDYQKRMKEAIFIHTLIHTLLSILYAQDIF